MRIVVDEMPDTVYGCDYFVVKSHTNKDFYCVFSERKCPCSDTNGNLTNPKFHCDCFVEFREVYGDLVREFFGDK